jgi:Alpha-L-fucosidase/F5/8 type C domain
MKTHPPRIPRFPRLTAAWIAALLGMALVNLQAQETTEFLRAKHGFLVTYVWSGDPARPQTVDASGHLPDTFDAFATAFDAEGLATDLEKWGVEYVIFSAWHFNLNPLFPSETLKRWGMADHCCQRDVIRALIDACKARNIKVMLYTHPRDGHDLSAADQAKTGWGGANGHDPQWETFDRKKWNDFTAELYQELISRYGDDLIGLMIDEGSVRGDSERVVDYPRLRRLLKTQQPDLLLQQNFFGNHYSLDVGAKELDRLREFGSAAVTRWPCWQMPVMINFAPTWWATKPAGENAVHYAAEDMFRYLVLQAGSNHQGGGVQWAAGNYAGGGWETGVAATMQQLGDLIRPIAPAIKQTLASTAFPTPAGTALADLTWGVATRATNDSIEYLHVLKPPADGSKLLKLPVPADGKRFEKAVLLPSSATLGFQQNDNGLEITLPATASWDRLDTVIALKVAANSPLQNLALWKAFRASSKPDPSEANRAISAAAAVDGDLKTAWSSRADNATLPTNEPAPADRQPWCQVDLGTSATLSRIEILGDLGPNLVLEISTTASFKDPTILSRRAESVANEPWLIELTRQPTARYLRLTRIQDGPPLTVAEFRVFGQFK